MIGSMQAEERRRAMRYRAMVFLVILVAPPGFGGWKVQPLAVDLGGPPDKVLPFIKAIEETMAKDNMIDSSSAFVMQAGMTERWDNQGNRWYAYYMRITGPDREFVRWEVPSMSATPEVATRDLLKNARLALVAAERCGGLARLCP